MKLKKLTAFAIAAAVAAGSFASITAFADDNTTDIGGTIKNNTSSYTLTIPAGNTNMTLTQGTYNSVGTLKVVRTNEDKTGEIPFDTGKKVSVTVSHANVLTNTDTSITANNTLAYKLVKGDTADSEEIASNGVIDFSASGIDAETGVNIGAVVEGDSTLVANGTYKDTITFTAEVETISTKTPADTPNITQADCTFTPSNGKSTLANNNITTSMEYSTDNGTTWTDITASGTINSLSAGTVQIRVKETDENAASESASITVPEVLKTNELVGPYTGDKLTVEFYDGETWNDMASRYDLIKIYSGRAAFGRDGFIYYTSSGSSVPATAKVTTSETYEVQ